MVLNERERECTHEGFGTQHEIKWNLGQKQAIKQIQTFKKYMFFINVINK